MGHSQVEDHSVLPVLSDPVALNGDVHWVESLLLHGLPCSAVLSVCVAETLMGHYPFIQAIEMPFNLNPLWNHTDHSHGTVIHLEYAIIVVQVELSIFGLFIGNRDSNLKGTHTRLEFNCVE
jgi:hypothetical protein